MVVDVDQREDTGAVDYLAQCVAQLDAEMDDGGHEQGGDGGWDGNNKGGANNDGGGCVGDEVDYDNLEEMIRVIGPKILLKSPKGLEKLERVKKSSNETMYGVEKGCPTHWTVLCFVLEVSSVYFCK